MRRLLYLVLTFLMLPLLQESERLLYAETIGDYVVRTSTTLDDDKVRMEISVWDAKLGKVVNWTSVEGRPETIDVSVCSSPAGAFPSPIDEMLCDAVTKEKEWFRRNFLPPRVRITVSSANIMETPALQSRRIATVPQGTVLKKVGEQDGWLKIIQENGEAGWIYREQVE